MKKSNQHGFAPILILIVVVAIVGFAAAAYFGLMGSKPQELLNTVVPGSTSLPKLKESDFTNISDPLIRKHMAAQYSKGSFRLTSNSSGLGKGSQSIIEVQYISDKDYRMHMTQMMDGKIAQETITMGDTMYMKDTKDNSWWKQVNKPDMDTKVEGINPKDFSRDEIIQEFMNKTTVTYTKLGEEACGTLTCYKYEEKNSEADSGTRTFWFDTKELLLRKEIHGYGEFTSESEYGYDGISIKDPSPVKDVPEGKSIYDMITNNYLESSGALDSIESNGDSIPSADDMEKAKKFLESMGNDYSTDMPIDDSTDGSEE